MERKKQLIIYKCKQAWPPDPGSFINNVKVPLVSEVMNNYMQNIISGWIIFMVTIKSEFPIFKMLSINIYGT